MAQLTNAERALLPDSAFAYVDAKGNRRLPIHDASHVRNALARFGQVRFDDDAARQRARQRLLAAARKHGIVPIGFMEAELRAERSQKTAAKVVLELSQIDSVAALETALRSALADPGLAVLRWVDGWVDGADRPCDLPGATRARDVTVLESRGAPAAALVHDRAALRDPDLREAVFGAVRLVVERQRLDSDPSFRRVDPARLPAGEVTFAFTDIEGSTELLTLLEDRYADVLGKVRRLIQREVRKGGGHVVDSVADETFSVFDDAVSAVASMVAVREGLAAARWPDGASVRVRAGLHTGEASIGEAGYVGLAVNTAARTMALGAGGQVLVTDTVRQACGTAGSAFRPFGHHRLKGLSGTVEVFEVP